MRRFKLTVSYDGTNYVGWQIQPRGTSIQSAMQDAIFRIAGTKVDVIGAGRTDAGVHALGQVAHCEMDCDIPCEGLKETINSILPRDIAVVHAEEAGALFHARKDAIAKRYIYRLAIGERRVPFLANRAWLLPYDLDVESIRKAAGSLEGQYDFESFRASGCTSRHAVRTLNEIGVSVADDWAMAGRGKMVHISFEGDGFVRHMIRNIVGTLVEVGRGALNADDVLRILGQKNRQAAGICAPACGLYLVRVFY